MSHVAAYTVQVGEEVVRPRELRWTRGLDQLQQLSPPRAGTLDAVINNHEGDYNPDVSPLHAGLPVSLVGDDGGAEHPLFRGILQRPSHRLRSFAETLDLSGWGMLSLLARKQGVTTGVYEEIRTDEAISHILDAAGWPANPSPEEPIYRRLDEGKTVLRRGWLDGDDVFSALRTLLVSEGPGALLYEDGGGALVFKSRHAALTEARMTAVQATYGRGYLPLTGDPEYDDGLADVVNHCSITVQRREEGDLETVWELGSDFYINAGQARTIEAKAPGDDLFVDAQTPTLGGGDFTVAFGSVTSVELNRTSGKRISITVTAGAGATLLRNFRLRARRLTLLAGGETVIQNSLDASASIAEHGLRPYPLAVWPEINPEVAQDFANVVVWMYRGGRPQLQFSTVNASEEALEHVLDRDIGDRVRVVLDRSGIDSECTLMQREDVLGRGLVHRVTFGTELADTTPWFLVGDQLDSGHVLAF